MLGKKFRLQLKSTQSLPMSVKTPYFTLRYGVNQLSYSRFGFIVSKRIDKRATVRNTVKRRMRAVIESKLEEMIPGYDLLFIAQVTIKDQQFKTIDAAISQILENLKLFQ